jgi:ABC-type amino acid transport substrate-binding protein
MPFFGTVKSLALASLLATCALPVLADNAAPAQKITIVYARELNEEDSRIEYPVRLLELALKKSGGNFEMRSDARPMPQSAAIKRLAAGVELNVVWSMTTKEREEQLLPIRIPIDKGLYGYRIAFVPHNQPHLLTQVNDLKGLSKLVAGQGHDWPDTEILRANGLQVETSSSYQNLFPMLSAGRFDFFPRSVLEIWAESTMPGSQNAVIDEKLLIHYPTALYFFVNKNNGALAQTITTGLNRAMADGSFDALYYERFGAVIKRANLPGRTRIELKNPLLPKETPLSNKSLWLDVNALPK